MKWMISVWICLVFAVACSSSEYKATVVKNGNVEISYRKTGSGDTAVVLVHGWAINKDYWLNQEPALASRYTVVSLDLGGHGQSGTNRDQWTIASYAEDVLSVIRQLNLNKVILVGHSMAGEICLQAAVQEPQKVIGLIGIDNFKEFVQRYSPEDEKQGKEFLQALASNYDSISAIFIEQGLFPKNTPDTAAMKRVIADARKEKTTIAVGSLQSLMYASLQDSALIGKLTFPLHLIVCDPPPNEDALKKIARAGYSIQTIHGTGHYPMIEKPAAFTILLSHALDQISKGK